MTGSNTESLIVIEGLDGTGKSTLATKLSKMIPAVCLKTPPEEFKKIRKVIDKTYDQCGIAAQLFYSSTVAYISHKAKSYLKIGKSVVVDRYWLSTHVYAKCRKSSVDLSNIAPILIKPDITVWLDLDDNTRQRRMKRRVEYTLADRSSIQNQVRLRQIFKQALKTPLAGKVIALDTGEMDSEQCAKIVFQEINRTLAA